MASPVNRQLAHGILVVEIVAILVLAYMRFVLNTLPLISGVNTGPGAILGDQQ